jgi:hypothetical protein
MPDFLLSFEYNLETTLLAILISTVVVAGFVWLTMSAVCRSRSKQLQTALEQQTTITEQQRTQLESERTRLESDLSNLKQQHQEIELKLTEKNAQTEQLEKEKQALQTEAERALALESYICQRNQQLAELDNQLAQQLQFAIAAPVATDSNQGELLWQRHQQVIAQLQQRLLANVENQNQLAQLQQAEQTWQATVVEKETALGEMNNKVEQQTAQLSELEQNLQQQHIEFEQLQQTQAEQQQLLLQEQQTKAELQQLLAQEQQAQSQSLQQLESLTLQLQQLEQQLAAQATVTESVVNTQGAELAGLQQAYELQQAYQVLEQKLIDSEAHIKQLQAELTQAQEQPKAQPTIDWDRKFTEQEATIAKLNSSLAEQANYLDRLEYDLEVKKLIIKDQKYPLQGVPATIVARQEADQARIDELENRLSPNKKSVKKTVEKVPAKPRELLNPATEQIEKITEKAKHFPEQIKGFYQKFLPKKG